MNNDELKALRTPLAVLVAVVALTGCAVYYTDLLAKKAAADLAAVANVHATRKKELEDLSAAQQAAIR